MVAWGTQSLSSIAGSLFQLKKNCFLRIFLSENEVKAYLGVGLSITSGRSKMIFLMVYQSGKMAGSTPVLTCLLCPGLSPLQIDRIRREKEEGQRVSSLQALIVHEKWKWDCYFQSFIWVQCAQMMFWLKPQVLASFKIAKHHAKHRDSDLELWPSISNEIEYKHKTDYQLASDFKSYFADWE